jgi:serine/threonine protein kinase
MSGSIESFSEGSDHRRSFIVGLAALLQIPERRIVIVSVSSGSIIVEIAFVRDAASSTAPLDIVSGLKDAAAAGKLQAFDATGLSVGGQTVSLPMSSSADLSPSIIAAIVGPILAALLVHSYVFVRIKALKAADSKLWIAASVIFGPFVWLIWSVREGPRKRSNKVDSNVDIVVSCFLFLVLLFFLLALTPVQARISTNASSLQLRTDDKRVNVLTQVASRDVKINHHVKERRGGGGTVYQVTWNGNPNYAMKKPHFTGVMTERDEAKFVKELRNQAQLQHPNCVQVYAVCLEKDNVFIVMEWMHGGSLWDRLQLTREELHAINTGAAAAMSRGLSLSARKRLEIAREICDGIQYMHSKGMVHGDIKSLNVLLGKEGNAKLCDFGLTTMGLTATTATDTHAPLSPFWSAPEILCQGQKHSPQTDIYAFGIVMWELLTCNAPYEGMTVYQIIGMLTSHQRPPIPSPIPAGFPAAYVTMMARCWDQDPSKRPSAAEVHQFLIDHDPSTQPNAPVELFPRDHRLAAAGHSSMLPCLVLALPDTCCAPVLQAVVSRAEQSVLRPSVQAVIAARGLSALEAQSIFVYTASSDFAKCPVHGAPFVSYNAALRAAQPVSVSAWRDYSFLLYSALLKLPSVACTVYRGLNLPLSDVSHLYWKGGFVWLRSPTSTTTDRKKTMLQFGNGADGAGTFMELRVQNAKEIEVFSAVPEEQERLIPQNTCFRVLQAFSAADVRLLENFGTLPPNVDLVVVEEVCATAVCDACMRLR